MTDQLHAVAFVAAVKGPEGPAKALQQAFAARAKALIEEHRLTLVAFHSTLSEVTPEQVEQFVAASALEIAAGERSGSETHVHGSQEPVDKARRDLKNMEN